MFLHGVISYEIGRSANTLISMGGAIEKHFYLFLKHLYICIRDSLQLARYAVTVTSYSGSKILGGMHTCRGILHNSQAENIS